MALGYGCQLAGIIPAYAGSTRIGIRRTLSGRDHPRVCGEHKSFTIEIGEAPGSSPRMRGARIMACLVNTRTGIIPAYAGSTTISRSAATATWDHPRVCGEHWMYWVVTESPPGSSPRMRGAPRLDSDGIVHYGIIPAYAGSTHKPSLIFVLSRDHPRVCGEHKCGQ